MEKEYISPHEKKSIQFEAQRTEEMMRKLNWQRKRSIPIKYFFSVWKPGEVYPIELFENFPHLLR